ncbi:hypothetical protein SEA_BURRO_41 [Microbacterium phage Burro]|uniref:Uncharacterized protein n=1 Tax=Microbacterium phage Burro TaxID=2315703 RepID=A0A386KMA2_9CAUD|nr:hypothetical protein HWB89_gp41 [Microbacterium phage Burro]AYD86184.1 hypothetical protein SEA_BURRO_41 [Microbacterium phage Burro]
MAGKQTIPAPIDRPLAKAYLREFAGWSTAYPPGLSEPTSLRIMENVQVTREGAVRTRPALRSVLTANTWLDANYDARMVGGFEHFFLNDGRKALLFAARGATGVVSFKVAVYNAATSRFDIYSLTDPIVGFSIPQGETTLNFTSATTFVKYLQIDNKIFALSDAGEDLRLFNVGTTKAARKVVPITVPAWDTASALTVRHPDAAWINNATKNTIPAAETPTSQTLISSLPLVGAATTASGQPFTLAGHGLSVGQAVILNATSAPGGFSVGTTYYIRTIPTPDTFQLAATPGGANINPTSAGTAITFTLGPTASGEPAKSPNVYNYGYFYTFENEVGESAASQMQTIRAQRAWSQWRFLAPDANGNPTTTPVTDPHMAMDQLVAILPQTVFDAAIAQGAVKWNLYLATWSDSDAVPPEGVMVGTRDLTVAGTTYQTGGWIENTAAVDIGTNAAPLPTLENRYNYSDPSSASQGLVAGDRLILVNDKDNGALIRWSSNQVGEYTNFTPSRGGGLKTLTSGNLLIPAAVKLWQNPQSVDTITILCTGVDGYSTAYYMAPAQINGQSDSTAIMGFEETTATPGTVSPYGVEVLNNALYHPLDTELMKSTASNYNINHSTMTDDIANKWLELLKKDDIVSTQHDNRLYYIVNNPDGEAVPPGCNGNEIWVLDAGKDQGSWSRWLIPAISLSKLEVAGKLYVAVARPESIFVLDDLKMTDDASTSGGTLQKAIPWKLETNTQGANRAHDAWARLQQVNVTLGNWRGTVRFGIRSWDVNGKPVELSKVYKRPLTDDLAARPLPFDISDFMLIRRDLMEWFFFAESVEEDNVVQPSYGRISYVQYRYAPVSVNVGYEYGSVETFEYGRSSIGAASNTDNGVPQPIIDTRRP